MAAGWQRPADSGHSQWRSGSGAVAMAQGTVGIRSWGWEMKAAHHVTLSMAMASQSKASAATARTRGRGARWLGQRAVRSQGWS
jgi:hypothetical protein